MVPIPACSCTHPLGNFPEALAVARRAAGPRVALLSAAVLLAACSREARAIRLPSDPGSELYRITCRSQIEPCRDKAAALCNGDYEVLENAGVPIEPPRASSAPGPRSTGSRYQRPDWVGELVVACGAPQAEPQRGENALGTTPTLPAVRAPLPDQLCVPGVTQLCLGPAACRGAQACLADGRGYGVCDCGTSAASDAGTTHGSG
jgi:hypothetical protein